MIRTHYSGLLIRCNVQDVDTLKEGEWIADTIIEFHEEYLDRTALRKSQGVKLMKPSVCYLVAHMQDTSDLASVVPPDLPTSQAIFIPVNDAKDITCADSGSHWSLLVYARPFNTFYYYDSLRDSNLNSAMALASKLGPLVSPTKPNFIHQQNAPQQENGADCGACVIAVIDVLVNRLLQPQTPGTALNADAIMHVTDQDTLPPSTVRRALRDIIIKLVKVANNTPGDALRAGDSVPVSTS
jgi:sentrin-specific protease 8